MSRYRAAPSSTRSSACDSSHAVLLGATRAPTALLKRAAAGRAAVVDNADLVVAALLPVQRVGSSSADQCHCLACMSRQLGKSSSFRAVVELLLASLRSSRLGTSLLLTLTWPLASDTGSTGPAAYLGRSVESKSRWRGDRDQELLLKNQHTAWLSCLGSNNLWNSWDVSP